MEETENCISLGSSGYWGLNDRRRQKSITRSAELECSRLKMYFEFFSGLLCEAKNVNLGEFGVYDIDVSQG